MFRGILLLCLALVGVVLVAGQQSPQEAQMIEKCFQPCNVPPEERNDISTQWLYKNTPSNICHLRCTFTAFGFYSNGAMDTQKVGELLKLAGFTESSDTNVGESVDQYMLRMNGILRTRVDDVRKALNSPTTG